MDPNPETDAPGAEPVADLVNSGGNRPGFGVQDLPNPGVAASVRRAVALLPPGQSLLLVAAAIIQASLGLLDLLGVALIGLLAAIAVSAVGVSELPSQVDSLLNFFGMGDMTVTQKTVIVAVVAVTVLVGKTALSALMAGRILRFLANRQADVSVRLARDFLSRPLIDVQRWTTSEAIYALGGGVEATRRLGISVKRTQAKIYMLVGALSGLAGILYVSLQRKANPYDLAGSELDIIAAVVLGGASIMGGYGTVFGTVLGVILISLIKNNLILLGVSGSWQRAAVGALLLIGITVQAINESRKAKNRRVSTNDEAA